MLWPKYYWLRITDIKDIVIREAALDWKASLRKIFCNLKSIIFELISRQGNLNISCGIALKRKP